MIHLFFVVHNYSGARTYANELLSFLCLQDNLCLNKVIYDSTEYRELTVLYEEGMKVVHLPKRRLTSGHLEKYARCSAYLLASLMPSDGKVIFHLNTATQVKLGLEARRLFGAKLVYTLHYLPNYFSLIGQGLVQHTDLHTTGDVLDREMATTADLVICVTRFAAKMLEEVYEVSTQKLKVIFNGVGSLTEVQELVTEKTREKLIEKYKLPKFHRYVVFVGRLERGKGVEKLVNAFHQFSETNKDTCLILVGGKRHNEDGFSFSAPQIIETGQVTQEEVFDYYRLANLGVIPSEYEQCSYVALEMMKHGVPLLVAKVPGLKELFSEGKNALFIETEPRKDGLLGLEVNQLDLFHKLQLVLHDETYSKLLKKMAHLNWKQKYKKEDMGMTTSACYENLFVCNL